MRLVSETNLVLPTQKSRVIGLPNGIGVMRFPDSSRYEGEFMQVTREFRHRLKLAEKGVRAKGEFMQVRKGVLESRRRIHASKKASTVHACRKGCSCME